MTAPSTTRARRGWLTESDCRLEDFRAVVEQDIDPADYAYADAVQERVLIYGSRLSEHVSTPAGRRDVQAELVRALADGPGIVVFKRAFADTTIVDRPPTRSTP